MTEIPFKLFYRPGELAKIADIHIRTVYRWIDMGKIKSIKIGRSVRIERGEFLRILKTDMSQMS